MKAELEYSTLDRHGEILLSSLIVRFKRSGEPVSLCKDLARSTDEWKTHIEGWLVAEENRSKARGHYENMRILAECRKTEEVSMRQMVSNKI